MGPSEFGRLKGPMTGPAYGIRSSAILAYHAKSPSEQVAWRNAVIARARRLGVVKGKSDETAAELRERAQSLRNTAMALRGCLTAEEAKEIQALEQAAVEAGKRMDSGMGLEECLAFNALGSRVPDARLANFAIAHKGGKLAAHCYVEAARPELNAVRFLSKAENAKLMTVHEAMAARGRALPGLLSVAADALVAAAAVTRVAPVAAVVAHAPKPPTLRERYQAHGRTLSLASKLRWTRRIFSHLHPNWTRGWWGKYTAEHGETNRECAQEHLTYMAEEARDNYEFTRSRPLRCWLGPYTQVEVEEDDRQWAEGRAAAEARALAALQDALDGEYLGNHVPTFCAIIQWGRGTLEHPAVTARKAEAKKAQKKAKRGNAKQRAAQEAAAAAAVRALPDYITATAASAYTQPMEAIRALNFKNLPLATTLAEQAQLREAMSLLVTRAGATVAKVRGALFVPTQGRGGPTRGFGFVECATAAGAQRVIMEAGARGTLELEFNGVTSQVFVELAASNRQTKDQMEAKKAKDAAERAAAQAKVRELMVASIRPSTKLELVAEVCSEATAAPVLAKVCLGDAVRARKEAEAAAEAAALRAEVQAMFSAPLGGILHAKPKAPQFKQSFAASAKKGAVAAKLEVVDEFTIKVNGVVKRIEAVEGTELARAQAVIRRQIADDAAKAKKSSRDKAYAQWEADKAAADADPTGWDVEDWVEPE